ncbi:CaiB/BaiF CoA transferase family protein [Janthinobacterium agaricidamnosum]|uniref:CoA-transferase III family protein n=1 Tax=Janthinobacterium agaricidamnosum NBRC 102515 = DSM 9628 TaxID=1349767 RepID=W0V8X9_9BURK|nr:CaiB/BaiF CoA-transferase family protein [Janthinobacterium agaricidamnosum]CDG84336.1 coA-transferase III family protein [Janthinobacterium agaricidamnosum NBRC 102515 = DSM 9628]
MSAALSHLKVLDLSRVLAGPWSGQVLADLGADVIKIERPGVGDDTRTWGPPYLKDRHGEATRESAYFMAANRGKQSVTVDISQPAGQEIIRELVKQSDILLENYKVGALKKYGLDYESLHAVNPRLIYCSITGFGQDGPDAQRAGYDFMIQGMGGLMSITGTPDTLPGGGPVKVGVAVTDVLTGMYATVGILAAVTQREKTGLGQHIDMALLDVQVAMLANQASNYLVGGVVPGRLGNAHPNIVPYQAFATSDGHVILAVGNDRQFASFSSVAGHAEWADDVRFASNNARVAHRAELVALLEPVLLTRSTRLWLDQLEAVAVPCGPINTIDQVFEEPQVRARQLVHHVPHALADDVPTVACPIRMSGSPRSAERAPPLLGQHTRDILRERLQLDDAGIDRLLAQGVI